MLLHLGLHVARHSAHVTTGRAHTLAAAAWGAVAGLQRRPGHSCHTRLAVASALAAAVGVKVAWSRTDPDLQQVCTAHADSGGRVKMIIDCDAGVDDAQALVCALMHRNVDVLAITATFGNCPLEHVLVNIKKTLLACDAYDTVPVLPGATEPLLSRPHLKKGAEYWHGKDGLGDATQATVLPHREPGKDAAVLSVLPVQDAILSDAHSTAAGRNQAVDAIIRIVREHPGEITLVALGPLTNVALAVKQDPGIVHLLKGFVFMGGALNAQGQRVCRCK